MLFVLLKLLITSNEIKMAIRLIEAFRIDLNRNKISVSNTGMKRKDISNAFEL
jgi:hypothetical protein